MTGRLSPKCGQKVVWGTQQNDRLVGDDGANQIYGGSGKDTFVFKNATGNDTIMDFEIDKERIDLSGTSIDSIGSLHRNTIQVFDGRIVISSIYREHGIQKHSDLWLEGVHEHDLTEKNFIF